MMNTSPALTEVLNHPAVWRGNDFAQVATPSVPTGYAELDVLLPGSGWPTGVLTEILVERAGIGELQLVMPAAAHITQSDRWLTMIAPPYLPYAPALASHGVKLSRLMLIRPKTLAQQLWACEQALQADSCGAVMLWLDNTPDRATENALRRLQLAAEHKSVLAFLFRTSRATPCVQAALRLHISRQHGNTAIRILKRRGGGIPAPVLLDLHQPLQQRRSITISAMPRHDFAYVPSVASVTTTTPVDTAHAH